MTIQSAHTPLSPSNVLRSGKQILHCGQAMHTGSGRLSHLSAGSNGAADPDLEDYLNTRVLHCDQCGFQMEIPS